MGSYISTWTPPHKCIFSYLDENSEILKDDSPQLIELDPDYNSLSDCDYLISDSESETSLSSDQEQADVEEVEDELCFLNNDNYIAAATDKMSK